MAYSSDSIQVNTLLILVRMAMGTERNLPNVLGPSADKNDECAVVWHQIFDLSHEQGVQAIALDGMQKWEDACPDGFCALSIKEMRRFRFEWIANAVKVETLYGEQQKVIGRLAALFSMSGLDMMVLKGYGLSLDYPVPSHRNPGDVDTYHFGRWKEADAAISAIGVLIDYSHHHHSVYTVNGNMVENHYDFLNRYSHKENDMLNAILEEMAGNSFRRVNVGNGTICLPPADFNALFLLRHAGAHFAAESINLKHILDWATFIAGHSVEVNWPEILPLIHRMGSWKFFCALNGLCIDILGFPEDRFPEYDVMEELQRRMLEDVFSPWSGRKNAKTEGWLFRLFRWKSNLWKHRMVYEGENIFLMFIRQGWSHLMKPKTIFGR